jgi:hypothetical protein
MSEDQLEKVYVNLPNHWAIGGESLWAKPLGNNLYEIRNIPFYAYGLNYFDIVRVDSSDRTKKPVVTEIVKPSGFQTLRIVFIDESDKKLQSELFDALRVFKLVIERANAGYVGLSIESAEEYDSIYDKLIVLEQNGVLEFETCEARNSDNFDAAEE